MHCTKTPIGKGNKKPTRFKTIPPDPGWETVVDFTDEGRTKGVAVEEAIKILKKINKQLKN